MEIDECYARHGSQHRFSRLHDTGDSWMAMERNPHFHALLQEWSQLLDFATQEQKERRHVERLDATRAFDRRKRHLIELNETAWAPGQHLSALAARELGKRVFAKPARCVDIARAQLHDAAAMGRAAHDAIG